MNILIITDDFFPNKGGIAHTLKNLNKEFIEKGNNVKIINPYYEAPNIFKIFDNTNYKLKDIIQIFKKRKQINSFKTVLLTLLQKTNVPYLVRIKLVMYLFTKPSVFLKTISNISILAPILTKMRFDFIFSPHCGDIIPLIYILSKIFHKKVVSLAHGTDFLIQNRFSLKKYYIQNIDYFILNCNWTKKLMLKIHRIEESKLIVINRGVIVSDLEVIEDKTQLRNLYKIPQNIFVILSVGRHISRKNFDFTIRAIAKLKEQYPSIIIKYFLIGDGPMTISWKELTETLNLQDEVQFLGEVDLKTRNQFYKLSDLFIMTAKTEKNDVEGFGIVFLEANFYKIPVIGSKSGGIVDAILDKETGYMINPENIEDLMGKILFLYKNEKIRKEMGEKGYKRVIKDFNCSKISDEYLYFFKIILT